MKQEIRIASPCSADWERMAGDERVRFCPECKLNVYNFSEMTEAEVEQIVAQREGRLCARFYQRPDGTMLTRNCPVGIRVVMQRVSFAASAALAAVMSVAPAMARPTLANQNSTLMQIQAARAVLALEVVDATGAVIPNALVTIVNEKTNVKIDEETDAHGQLRLFDVPPGTYEITIVSRGFRTLTLGHVAVPAPETVKLQLDVAVMGGVVTVTRPPIETKSCDLSGVLSEPSSANLAPAQAALALEVVDPMGGAISNAQVTIVNEKTNAKFDEETDADGRLHLFHLPTGIYEITISAKGFKPLTLSHVAVPAPKLLKPQLEIGAPAMMGVVVIGRSPVETKSYDLSGDLAEHSSENSAPASNSTQHSNIFRRFLSGVRRIF